MKVLTIALAGLATAGINIAPTATAAAPGYHLLRSTSIPGDGGWDYLTLDSKSRRLYIARSTHASVVDIDSGKLIGDIPDLQGVHGVALDTKNGHGFTSNGRANTVTVFDIKTLKKIVDIPVGTGPDAILFDQSSGYVFTFNGRGQSSTVIDVNSNKVIGTIALPGKPEFPVTDGRGHIYDNIEDKNEIVSIDIKSMKVDHEWPIAPGEAASGLAFDVKGKRLFAVADNQKLVVMNSATGAVVATPAIGSGPDACAYDPKTRLVFSPNGEDGTMTVIHQDAPDKYSILETIPTQAGARTFALDEKTHHIFTVAAKTVPPAPGAEQGRRRSYVPGSFTLLEYGAN